MTEQPPRTRPPSRRSSSRSSRRTRPRRRSSRRTRRLPLRCPARLRLPAGRDPGRSRAHGAGRVGRVLRSGRGKTIGLIVAGVVAVGALGGIGAAIFGGDDEEAFTDTTTGGTGEPGEEVTPEPDGGILDAEPDRLGHARAQRRRPSRPPTRGALAGSRPRRPTPTLDPEPGGRHGHHRQRRPGAGARRLAGRRPGRQPTCCSATTRTASSTPSPAPSTRRRTRPR